MTVSDMQRITTATFVADPRFEPAGPPPIGTKGPRGGSKPDKGTN